MPMRALKPGLCWKGREGKASLLMPACLLSLAGLAFKQTSDSVILFVVTTETVLSYNMSAKDRRVSAMYPNCYHKTNLTLNVQRTNW